MLARGARIVARRYRAQEARVTTAPHAPILSFVEPTTLTPTVERDLSDAEYAGAATLRAALRRFEKERARVLHGHGLTAERYGLLLAVRARAQDGRQTTTADLSDDLQLAHSSMTQLARRAKDAGLVSRRVSSVDGRVRYLALSDAGAAKLAAAAELGPKRQRLITLLRAL